MICDNLAPATVLPDWNIIDFRLGIVEADLKDLYVVKAAMEGCETINHLAAEPDIAKFVTLEKLNAE